MPFRPVQPEKLSSAVVRQIGELILHGILRPGERLPAERDLAKRLAVSRPSLRGAIARLQAAGMLTARPGAGVYVADVLGSAFSPALRDLMSRHEGAVADYLAFRRDMEGLAAERAARAGSDTDLQVVARIFDKIQSAHEHANSALEARLDAQFHMAIVEASHNVVMLHMMGSMYELLREGVICNRKVMFGQSVSREDLLAQHCAINAALQARHAAAARKAVETHLDYVQHCLARQSKAARDEDIARLRLYHEG